ncbi:MAG: sel1 repeat family protein [Rhodospirillales bacterium]|nr:sel1 repeat family protein [Rhodospirillales bacterium]
MVQARRWYERAAEKGYGPAQYQLGVLWERGDGVPADPVEARGWYARAAAQGLEPARAALDRIDTAGTAGTGRRALDAEPSAEVPARAAARPNPPASPPRPPPR